MKLDDLGWPEATLFELFFDGEELKFSMLDILSYGEPLKFEIVNVSISDIEALRVELIPYFNKSYQPKVIPIEIGEIAEDFEGFEGIIYDNSLCDIKADYFWISSDLKANKIDIFRTGKYKYVPNLA